MLWPIASDNTEHDAWLVAYVHQSGSAGCNGLQPILLPPAQLLVGSTMRGSLLQRAVPPPCRTLVSTESLLSRSGLKSCTPTARTEACHDNPCESLPTFQDLYKVLISRLYCAIHLQPIRRASVMSGLEALQVVFDPPGYEV